MQQEEREKIKEKMITLFKNTSGVTVGFVCQKTDVSRKTFYEWRKNDKKFQEETDILREDKKKDMDDFAERILFKKITEEDNASVFFYLKTRHPEYNRNRVEIENIKGVDEQREKINELLQVIREQNKKNVETETGETE